MKGVFRKLYLIVIICLISGCSQTTVKSEISTETKEVDLVSRAQDFVSLLAAGDFESATINFDDTMKATAPANVLEQTWNKLIDQVGPYQGQTGTTSTQLPGREMITVTCQFERGYIDVVITFDFNGIIHGFTFK